MILEQNVNQHLHSICQIAIQWHLWLSLPVLLSQQDIVIVTHDPKFIELLLSVKLAWKHRRVMWPLLWRSMKFWLVSKHYLWNSSRIWTHRLLACLEEALEVIHPTISPSLQQITLNLSLSVNIYLVVQVFSNLAASQNHVWIQSPGREPGVHSEVQKIYSPGRFWQTHFA